MVCCAALSSLRRFCRGRVPALLQDRPAAFPGQVLHRQHVAFRAGIPAFQAVGDHGRAASLFANHDAANLALKVNGLLSQPAEIRELAARGQDRSQMYDWNTVASRVEQVYHTATLKGRKVTCS